MSLFSDILFWTFVVSAFLIIMYSITHKPKQVEDNKWLNIFYNLSNFSISLLLLYYIYQINVKPSLFFATGFLLFFSNALFVSIEIAFKLNKFENKNPEENNNSGSDWIGIIIFTTILGVFSLFFLFNWSIQVVKWGTWILGSLVLLLVIFEFVSSKRKNLHLYINSFNGIVFTTISFILGYYANNQITESYNFLGFFSNTHFSYLNHGIGLYDRSILLQLLVWTSIVIFVFYFVSISKDNEKQEDTEYDKQRYKPSFRKKRKKRKSDNKYDRLIETILLTKIKHSLVDESVELLEILKEGQNSPLLVTVLGEFSSGKSTFINALLKEKLLAMKIVPTTATITKLQYGIKKGMKVYKVDGRIEKYELNDLNKFTVETHIKDNEILSKIFYVQLEIKNEFLKEIDIADTPGFNSKIERHSEITKNFIKHSDVIIWLFNSEQMLKKSEVETLEKYCKNFKPIVILNKIDVLDLENPNDIFKVLDTQIKKIDGLVEKVFPVSSKSALNNTNGGYEKSGMQDVVDYFYSNVVPNAKSTKNKMTIIKLLDVVKNLQMVRKEIDSRIDKISKKIALFKKKVENLDKYISKWNMSIKNWENDWKNDNITYMEMLKNITNYFGVKAPSQSIINLRDDFLHYYNSLVIENEKINEMYSELQQAESKLSNLFLEYEQKWDKYQNSGFGMKSFVDNVSSFFTGEDFTEEKKQLNRLSDEYNEKRALYNSEVKKYNNYLDYVNNKWYNLNERINNFLNNDVLEAINSQHDILVDLDSEINKEKSEIKELEKQHTIYINQLDIFNNDIISDTQALYTDLIEKSENHNGEFVNFEEMITEFKAFSSEHSDINWKNLYSRSQILSVITESRGKEVEELSQSEQIAYEEKVAQRV